MQRQQARLDRALFKLMAELDRVAPAQEEEEDDEEDGPANDNAENGRNEPKEPSSPPPDEPLSGDVLPLTPQLEALLDSGEEDAWLRFVEGRTLQVDRALRAAGLPGLAPRPG